MPPIQLRLIAAFEPDPHMVRLTVTFAAPVDDLSATCAPARLHAGDGAVYDLGLLCAPTMTAWQHDRSAAVLVHRYTSAGPHVAFLEWGAEVFQATVVEPELTRVFRRGPLLSLFSITSLPERPLDRLVRFSVDGLATNQQVRLDGGAGQIRSVPVVGDACRGELELNYAKPGAYTVTLDVLDDQGFWIVTVAQSPIELAEPELPHNESFRSSGGETLQAPPEETALTGEPWLPYRNFKPVRSGIRAYLRPGAGSVSRIVNPWVWLTARTETVVDGQRWFQTAQGDWVPASEVTFFQPTSLRGILLSEMTPPPPPPPPQRGDKRGVVTAATLNVRARPGFKPDNPPVATLRAGAEVSILEEVRLDSVAWYRIDENRWIHGGYVRLLDQTEPPPSPSAERRGIVTASTLNVRARPGVMAGNPPVAVLRSGAGVTIYEDERVGGELWHRIGENRWIAAQWVRLIGESPRTIGGALEAAQTRLPFGWVVPDKLAVYGRPEKAPDNLPVAELRHYDVVRVGEERQGWLRIADQQWVDGRNIGVARFRPRPAKIGAGERWVAICLSEQTLVAYEDDLPVFAALVSTGAGGTPTVQGIFRTWRRLPTGKMAGPGYYIEDVTWTCYFHGGYALHTAYWHDKFGTVRSHGCVNMTPYDAWWVYQWSAASGPASPTVYVYWR